MIVLLIVLTSSLQAVFCFLLIHLNGFIYILWVNARDLQRKPCNQGDQNICLLYGQSENYKNRATLSFSCYINHQT